MTGMAARTARAPAWLRTWKWFRDPVSGLSHLAGAMVAVIGLIWISSTAKGSTSLTAGVVFGASMVLLFLSSAAYHLLPLPENRVAFLRKLDHESIYVFIAGSYTPVCVLLLPPDKGSRFLALVWAIAAIGISIKLFFKPQHRWIRASMYLAMGWMSVFILPDLWAKLPAAGMAWLLVGGGFYFFGAIIYATKRPNPFPPYFGFHEIWHLFVLGGTFSHFWLMKDYVLNR
jgi:hemolysin III